MVDGHCSAQHMMVESVQLIDLENTAPIFLKAGRWIKGMLAGNDNWRSPEAHLKGGGLNKPTDMFFFGIVVGTILNCFGGDLSLNTLLVYFCYAWTSHSWS